MKKIYIHDDGSSVCVEHAGANLAASIKANPDKKLHWTPRGTWELVPANYYPKYKKATGVDFDCESCFDFFGTK